MSEKHDPIDVLPLTKIAPSEAQTEALVKLAEAAFSPIQETMKTLPEGGGALLSERQARGMDAWVLEIRFDRGAVDVRARVEMPEGESQLLAVSVAGKPEEIGH